MHLIIILNCGRSAETNVKCRQSTMAARNIWWASAGCLEQCGGGTTVRYLHNWGKLGLNARLNQKLWARWGKTLCCPKKSLLHIMVSNWCAVKHETILISPDMGRLWYFNLQYISLITYRPQAMLMLGFAQGFSVSHNIWFAENPSGRTMTRQHPMRWEMGDSYRLMWGTERNISQMIINTGCRVHEKINCEICQAVIVGSKLLFPTEFISPILISNHIFPKYQKQLMKIDTSPSLP